MISMVVNAWRAVFNGGKRPPEPAKKAAAKLPAKAAGSSQAATAPPADDTAAVIADAIQAAKKEAGLASPAGPAKAAAKKPVAGKRPPQMTPARERLIQDAIAIQRQKTHVFDSLSAEAKEKLMVMALHALAPEVLEAKRRQAKKK